MRGLGAAAAFLAAVGLAGLAEQRTGRGTVSIPVARTLATALAATAARAGALPIALAATPLVTLAVAAIAGIPVTGRPGA